MPTATAKLLDPVLQVARHSRQDPQALLAAARLESVETEAPGSRIPAAAFSRLLEELTQRGGNDRLALRVGEATQPRMLGSVGFLMATAADLRAAFQALIDYLPLLCEGIHLQMEQQAEGTWLLVEPEQRDQRRTTEWFMACLLNWPRWLSGKQVPALKVQFSYPPPADADAYSRFFAAELEYNADHNRLLIPNSYFKLPCLDANEEMHRLHLEFADNMLSDSGREGALVAQVKSLIRHALTDAQGGVRREKVAADLNLSLRTLQRKLGRLDTSFQALYDQTRKELALQQIQKGGISFGELSFMLGFANQSAFQKAFKRWMGVAPSRYRNKIKPSAPLMTEPEREQTLADLIEPSGLDIDRFIPVAIQLVNLLAPYHERGEPGPPLYPGHIAIDRSLGEIRLAPINPGAPQAASALERLHYLAPECCEPGDSASTIPADLYALGCLFHQLLLGRPPFVFATPGALLRAHREAEPRTLEQLPPRWAALVARLLSKHPQRRYPGCQALLGDLLTLGRQRQSPKTDEPTDQPPQRAPDTPPDAALRLRWPDARYGRDAALQPLADALADSQAIRAEPWLIRGPAGIGKTTLCRALRATEGSRQWLHLCGRFDPPETQQPHSAFIQIVRQLLRIKLASAKGEFQRWQAKLDYNRRSNLKLLSGLIDEIPLITTQDSLFDAPEAPELAARQAGAIETLLESVADQPLALWLDHSQWMDPASRDLFLRLLDQASSAPLLLIAIQRGAEPSTSTAFQRLNHELADAGSLRQLEVPAFNRSQVHRLVADLFPERGTRPVALASWLYRQTQGNPGKLRQQILRITQQQWLRRDPAQPLWRWQPELMQQLELPAEIRALCEQQLDELPPMTREMLAWGCALGERFDLNTLASSCGQPAARVAIHLWPAIEQGLLLAEDHRSGDPRYRFVHESVRLAAYRQQAPQQRRQMHLGIARVLQRRFGRNPQDVPLPTLVDHLNRAYPLTDSHEGRLELIGFNLQAAAQCGCVADFDGAADFVRKAHGLLRPEDWRNHPHRCEEVYLQLARAHYLCGKPALNQPLYAEMEAYFQTPEALGRARLQQGRDRLLDNRPDQAISAAVQGLQQLGHPLPEDPSRCWPTLERLVQHPLEAWSQPAQMAESVQLKQALLQLAIQAGDPTEESLPVVAALTELAGLNRRHGDSALQPLALAGLSFISHWYLGDRSRARQLATLSLAQNRDREREHQAAADLFNGCYNLPWLEPVRDSLARLKSARNRSLEAGDWYGAAQALTTESIHRCLMGQPLEPLEERLQSHRDIIRRIGLTPQLDTLQQGLLPLCRQLRDGDAAAPEPCGTEASPGTQLTHWLLAYLLDRRQQWPALLAGERLLESRLAGQYGLSELVFIGALMRLKLYPGATPAYRRQLLREITLAESRLAYWNEACPANFSHRHALLMAERLQLDPDTDDRLDRIIAWYERAIDHAETEGFIQHQALANEQFGRFWQARGKQRLATPLLDQACALYRRWGATTKAEKLQDSG